MLFKQSENIIVDLDDLEIDVQSSTNTNKNLLIRNLKQNNIEVNYTHISNMSASKIEKSEMKLPIF